ncbi:MAG: hypothetical protein R3316_00705 [Rhodovibrionaceae bacterium]|nr:hypothetical protein [Rhodovibrionaceae bacterium]
MAQLQRLKPDPIPAIHPVPEYLAEGRTKAWYEEMKAALQVPWMGVVTMAFAHYPAFFAELWRGLKPLVGSAPFVEACAELRALAETQAARFDPPDIRPRLEDIGYAPREIAGIAAINDVFSHGNQPYVIIATIARGLLEGREMGGATAAPAYQGRHAPDVDAPFVLMEAHHADAPTRAVYEEVKAALGLPFVNTDYRAFARWPSYWAAAWEHLKPVVVAPAYEEACQTCHERVAAMALDELPNPGGLNGEALRAAAAQDGDAEEVLAVTRLFQWLLPGLIVNVAYLRHQLAGSAQAMP